MLRNAFIVCLLNCGIAFGQAAPAASAKPVAFEVVSIRPIPTSGRPGGGLGILPDGYRIGGPISLIIQEAYYPMNVNWNWSSRIHGGPSWLIQDSYDITAKISDADLPEWSRQRDLKPEQRVLVQQMLQSMLADRCKLVAHRVPTTIDGFALVVGKRGPRLTLSTPGAPLPTGIKLPDGGVWVPRMRGGPQEIHVYNATMADLAGQLSNGFDGHPILDKTGLTGHYDIVLSFDYDPAVSLDMNWDLNALGLRLEPLTIPFTNLVIDHIERPSPN